ncbi:MAG: biopolymer transporter ExbD [Verrucomicrobiota bacterium]
MKLKRRRIKRGRIEIIPMIDTIVILLIFYMTFSRFAEAGKENGFKLPDSRAGDEFKQLPNQVIINMYNKDEVYIDKQKYTIDEVPPFLQRIREKDPRYANMSLILRGNREMTYTDLSAFMRACAKMRITDITFTTSEIK